MNMLNDDTHSEALHKHVEATGRTGFTAAELQDILKTSDMAVTIRLIQELVADGRLLPRAQYVALNGSHWTMDEEAYANAIRENGFENPLTGEWVDGCVELAPFWIHPSAA